MAGTGAPHSETRHAQKGGAGFRPPKQAPLNKHAPPESPPLNMPRIPPVYPGYPTQQGGRAKEMEER